MYTIDRRRVVQLGVAYSLPAMSSVTLGLQRVEAISLCSGVSISGRVTFFQRIFDEEPVRYEILPAVNAKVIFGNRVTRTNSDGNYRIDCVRSGHVFMTEGPEELNGTLDLETCTFAWEPGWEAGFVTLVCGASITLDCLSFD